MAAIEVGSGVVSDSMVNALACFDSCRTVCVHAHAFGKRTCRPSPDGVRLILPLSMLWSLADMMIASRLHEWLNAHVPATPGCMEAGVVGVGASHAALGVRLVVEKGLGAGSAGAVAQADIKQYYDHANPTACGAWLVEHGCDPTLAGAAVRHQLAPEAAVVIGAGRAEVGERARGALIGSRVAGAVGRVAIRDVMIHVESMCAHRAFGPSHASVLMCAYVDNNVDAGRDSSSARAILSQVEQHLRIRSRVIC